MSPALARGKATPQRPGIARRRVACGAHPRAQQRVVVPARGAGVPHVRCGPGAGSAGGSRPLRDLGKLPSLPPPHRTVWVANIYARSVSAARPQLMPSGAVLMQNKGVVLQRGPGAPGPAGEGGRSSRAALRRNCCPRRAPCSVPSRGREARAGGRGAACRHRGSCPALGRIHRPVGPHDGVGGAFAVTSTGPRPRWKVMSTFSVPARKARGQLALQAGHGRHTGFDRGVGQRSRTLRRHSGPTGPAAA